jgi:hypothetical protein
MPPLWWEKTVSSTLGDAYYKIGAWQSQSWYYHDVRNCRLSGQMPWSAMEGSRYRQQQIGHVPPDVHPLRITQSFNGCSPGHECTHIQLHAASYSCCFQSKEWLFNVHHSSYCWWLHWQLRGGLNGHCIYAVWLLVTYLTKCMPISWIWIRSDLDKVVVYPWISGVGWERKMITKRRGKSWWLYSYPHVRME